MRSDIKLSGLYSTVNSNCGPSLAAATSKHSFRKLQVPPTLSGTAPGLCRSSCSLYNEHMQVPRPRMFWAACSLHMTTPELLGQVTSYI